MLDFSQFEFVPGIRAALKKLATLQLPMIVISNQAAVGKGLLDSAGLEEVTARMQQALLEDGTFLNAAYFCTHRVDEKCICRKPKPELIYRAAEDFNIDLGRSIFMGILRQMYWRRERLDAGRSCLARGLAMALIPQIGWRIFRSHSRQTIFSTSPSSLYSKSVRGVISMSRPSVFQESLVDGSDKARRRLRLIRRGCSVTCAFTKRKRRGIEPVRRAA